MRELLLLRHGKSDWNVPVRDFARPLKKRGRRGATLIGKWLLSQQCIPEQILSSPAERTMETASRCGQAMGLPESRIDTHPELYLAELNTLLKILTEYWESSQRLMIVGHNPGLDAVLTHLAATPPLPREDGKLMTTACLARLEFPDTLKSPLSASAELRQLIRARDLDKNNATD